MTFLIFTPRCITSSDNEDSKVVYDRIQRVLSKAGDLSFIDQNLFTSRAQSFQSSLSLMGSADSADSGSSDDSEILGRLAGSLNTILEYAGKSDRLTLLSREAAEDLRPMYSVLNNMMLRLDHVYEPKHWKEALREYFDELEGAER